MKFRPILGLMPVMIMICGNVATAQTQSQTQPRSTQVYRCGPEGRDLRDSPCPGALRASEARIDFDQPGSAQIGAAKARAAAEARLADALEQKRLKQEAQARLHASTATGIGGQALAPADKAASSPKSTTAKLPHSPKAPKPPKAPDAPGLPKLDKPAKSASSAG